MKHIKKFKTFEELDRSTYMNAADLLNKRGHHKRANDIRKHASNIFVTDEEIEYYTVDSTHTKVVNPIIKVGKIIEMKIDKSENKEHNAPQRTIIDKVRKTNTDPIIKHLSNTYELRIVMDNGDFFKILVGEEIINEFFYFDDLKIKFATRENAYKFVKMCNDFIKGEIGKTIPDNIEVNFLKVNDYYSN